MSLDKWLKDEDAENNLKKKKRKRKEKEVKSEKKVEKKQEKGLNKFILKCSKSKCGYQKTLMKRELSEKDLICPRCKSKMKVT